METWIDPTTGDYAPDQGAIGALARDPAGGLANAVYLRLQTPLRSWFGNPDLGSRLHELQREKDTARSERLAKQYAEAALQGLVDDGRARSVTCTTRREKDDSGAGRLLLAIEVVDARGDLHTFTAPVPVA